MKLNKMLLVSILLLTVLSLGTVCAQDNMTSNLGNDRNLDNLNTLSEVNDDINNKDMETTIIDDDKLSASCEDIVGEITSDNVAVDVSDVFKGCETTIFVTASEATGIVNITVGEKTYVPEFVGGVARQTISEYDIGVNNVTVKYNDIVKETSFKVLDGVVTNETFDDYFDLVGNYYQLRSFIPEGTTLDFRGYIKWDDRNKQSDIKYLSFNKPYNLTSTTGDASIGIPLNIERDAIDSNVSNIKINRLFIYTYCNAINLNVDMIFAENGFKIVDSTIGGVGMHRSDYTVFNNTLILNCTVDMNSVLDVYFANNVSVINSTFNNGLDFKCKFQGYYITNVSIENCIFHGKLNLDCIYCGLIENCTLDGGCMELRIANFIVKNNFINASSLTYGINIFGHDCRYNKFTDNRIYSKNYYGNRAIAYQHKYDISTYPETYNVFENNTPTQADLNIGFTSNPIFYGENITVVVNMSGIEGNVVFLFNGEKLSTVKLVNGVAKQTIDNYELGINNVTVSYEDVINDIYAINHTSFKVNKVNYCPINLDYENVTEEIISFVDVILPDDAKGVIVLNISNDNYCITIKKEANGSTNIISIPALLEGNYTMSVAFISVKYVTNSTTNIIRSIHIPVYELTAKDISMDYKDGSKYKVCVTKDGKSVGVGEIVKITFNGKTREVKTDKNGYATLTLDGVPKTYAIKAEYNGVTKSSKVTIKNVLKASSVSKKKAKIIKFSATLKTSNGKAITGKKITFKLKGKIYTAKTNKKGVATINLKNLKVGKYTITSTYGACVVKNTIKIRK